LHEDSYYRAKKKLLNLLLKAEYWRKAAGVGAAAAMSPGSCGCPTAVPHGHGTLGAAHLLGEWDGCPTR